MSAISIIGCDLVPMGYYRVKTEQEQVVKSGPVPWSIVAATQFHELAAMALAAAGKWRVLPIPACGSRRSRQRRWPGRGRRS